MKSHKRESVDESPLQEGLLTMDHMSVMQGLNRDLTTETQMPTLRDRCIALPQRPHPNHIRQAINTIRMRTRHANMRKKMCNTTDSVQVNAQVGSIGKQVCAQQVTTNTGGTATKACLRKAMANKRKPTKLT